MLNPAAQSNGRRKLAKKKGSKKSFLRYNLGIAPVLPNPLTITRVRDAKDARKFWWATATSSGGAVVTLQASVEDGPLGNSGFLHALRDAGKKGLTMRELHALDRDDVPTSFNPLVITLLLWGHITREEEGPHRAFRYRLAGKVIFATRI